MSLQSRKVIKFRPSPSKLAAETIVLPSIDEYQFMDRRSTINPESADLHLSKQCECFTCKCGSCKCGYSPTKRLIMLPPTTYQQQYTKKEDLSPQLQVNYERLRYRPMNHKLLHRKQQNESSDFLHENARPHLIINPNYNFSRIFNSEQVLETQYQKEYSPKNVIDLVSNIKPRNNINILHEFPHFYLNHRKPMMVSIDKEFEQYSSFKGSFTKPNIKSRNLSFQFQSSYKQQFPLYSASDLIRDSQEEKLIQDEQDKLIQNINQQKEIKSTYSNSYFTKQITRCPAKSNLEELRRKAHLLDSQYYMQNKK